MNKPRPVSPLCERWGTPPWWAVSKYDYVKQLSEAAIRWEFVRRQDSYRLAWKMCGARRSKTRLLHLLDPTLDGFQVGPDLAFDDRILEGAATGDVFVAPPLETFFLSSQEQDHQIALHYGRQFIDLIDAGYTLFVVNPKKSAGRQAEAIKEKLLDIQDSARKKGEKGRSNARAQYSPVELLRVLDAYAQEGIPSAQRGTKTSVGREIFESQMDSGEWHKVFDDAYRRAVERAS